MIRVVSMCACVVEARSLFTARCCGRRAHAFDSMSRAKSSFPTAAKLHERRWCFPLGLLVLIYLGRKENILESRPHPV